MSILPPSKSSILKQRKIKGKSPPQGKKKELRFEIAYDDKGVEKFKPEDANDKRNRTRGRQALGQKDS